MKENGCCQNAALFINLTTLRGVSVIDVPSNSTKHSTADTIERILWAVAISMMLFAFCLDTPSGIFQGIWRIILHPDGLITDYSSVGGFGATFFNAGLIMAASIIIVKLSHAMISGPTIACIFLMAGFAMFGKNVANIWPIILGVFLFSTVNHESFSKYVYIALYATALSPLITAVAIESENMLQKLIVVIVFGAVIGFLTPPLATYCLRVHQGYNLYNVGFAAGLVGTLIVSVMKSFGFEITTSLVWTYENNPLVVGYMYLLSTILMVAGWWMTPDKRSLKRIYRHSGRLVADFILLDGLPITLFNMGTLGIFATTYILLIGGTINGATMGGIFTIIGFGAFGKHLRNVVPVVGGVFLGSLVKVWSINDPSVQLGALFATALAPISGQFGWPYGILMGFLHSSMVLNTSILHGGLNLYNNGFSAGILALIMVPIIETFQKRKNHM